MFRKIKEEIDKGRKFLITAHIDPDGDAVGSVFSLYWVLKGLGKEPVVYLKDPVPYRYEFLPGPADLLHLLPNDRYDVIFVLDSGNLFRVGKGHDRLKEMGPIINIDHHLTNDTFGFINMIDQEASSTGEILFRLFESMDVAVDYNVAVNIYTAIFTDTGSFRYENTTPATFLICEKMLGYGVKPAHVAQMVHENHPKERFKLLGRVLSTLRTYEGDRFAFVHVTDEMFRLANAKREYTDGFVEYVREIRGVEVAVLLRQIEDGKYKASMRSKGAVNVAEVCNLFGGGGHRAAAGCEVTGPIGFVEERLVKALSGRNDPVVGK